MKIPKKYSPQHSFSARLTLWVVLTTMAIFIILTIIITNISTSAMMEMSTQASQSRMEIANEKVNSTFMGVEIAIDNIIPEVETVLNTPDQIYPILKKLLELNPAIIGSAVAFEPNYYPSKGEFFSPYAYKDIDSTILTKQLGTKDYQYHYMDWYQIPKLLNKKYWSEPYYDKGGGEQMMTTYSCPLYDKDNKMYAIMTADVSLEWLTEMMKQSDLEFNQWLLRSQQNEDDINTDENFLYKHAYTFIIGRSGTYISHPSKERILNETYFVNSFMTPDSTDEKIGYEMLEGKSGISEINRDGTDFVMIYAPIKRTGWSMATAIPAKVIYHMALIVGLIIIATMLLGLIILYIVCRTTLKHVTSPLARFSRSANEIAQGNFNAPLPEITTKDEMKELYDSFKMMQNSLTDRIEELKVANEQKGRIEGELQTARSIQMSMIPKIFPAYPERTDMDIFAKLTPAKEVGGDLYDFFIRNEKLYLCVGDVSGKGVPASLLMAVTRSLFRTVSNHESDPAKIVTLINDAMSEDNVEIMFVTLFIAVLDLPTGLMRYCNAGHCAPVIIDTEAHLLPIIANLPIGLASQFKFEGQSVTIKPDTTIFLYTDGVTEAENKSHELFDDDRLIEVSKKCVEENIVLPDDFVNEIEQSIHQFVKDAEQSDDMTMMAVRYTKKEETARLRRSITLPNNIETIPQLSEFIEGVGEELEMDMSLTMSLNLAIEEAVVNVMEYAYPPGTEGNVEIEAVANEKRLKIIISDSGIPFDPTKKEKVDTTLSAEERPIGGLGIHLVREIMDSVNYEYRDHKNILTLRKQLKN